MPRSVAPDRGNQASAGTAASRLKQRPHASSAHTKGRSATIKKNPTLADLNDSLKASDIYDTPTWRKIQHLGDIRNLCDHKKDRSPTEAEATELITGVKVIVKTIF